eukprot:TRINITY_DN51713_c0_g1_i1.p1 TRINITY_DN51713_c0_g1~~TRINITY_DN51713_c0_g1_i1.p1  ORF type:complete len:1035 (-),score=58.55 TRINITY_DN51713_c0_g1_i1:101-3205(-)
MSGGNKEVDTFIKNVERAILDESILPLLLQDQFFITDDANITTKFIQSTTGLRVLMSALHTFLMQEPFVEATTLLLYNCVNLPTGKLQKQKATQAIAVNGAKTLFTIIPKYEKHDVILQQTTGLLARLCKNDTKLATLARLSGALSALISVMREPVRASDTHCRCLDLLGFLALSEQNRTVMHRHEILPVVIGLCRRYTKAQDDRSAVLNPALGLLRNICCGNKQYSRELVTRGGVGMLLELLQPSDTAAGTYQQALDLLTTVLSGQQNLINITQGIGTGGNGDVAIYKDQLVSQILCQVERKSDDELADITTALMRFQGINDLPLPEGELGAFWEYPISDTEGKDEPSPAATADLYTQFSPELHLDEPPASVTSDPSPDNVPQEVISMRGIGTDGWICPPAATTCTPPQGVPEPVFEASSELKRVVVQRLLRRLKEPQSQLNESVYDNPPTVEEVEIPLVPASGYNFHVQSRGVSPAPKSPSATKQTFPSTTSTPSTSTTSTSSSTPSTPTTSTPVTPLSPVASPTRCKVPKLDEPVAPLRFNSDFECGNLRRAVRVSDREYDIILHGDINSPAHIQWFLFAIEGMCVGVTYHFHIINMIKPAAASTQGQKPLLLSEKMWQNTGVGWHRVGTDILRLKNAYSRRQLPASLLGDPDDEEDVKDKKKTTTTTTTSSTSSSVSGTPASHVTLNFSLTFPHSNDCCYLAFSYPYSYSDVQRYIHHKIPQQFPNYHKYCRNQVLCKTISGNVCNLLTITNFDDDAPVKMEDRKICFFSARIHPAETSASWMMHGVLDKLLDETNAVSVQLRNQFIFKVLPMLNPDGVVNGNTRCNLSGRDLNRTWLEPDKVAQPTVYNWKRYIQHVREVEKRKVLILCDLHGHSRAQQIFTYGCCEQAGVPTDHHSYIYPKLCSEAVPYFWIDRCSWIVQKTRETTGRVVGWRQCGVPLSYTVEASMCGGKNVPLPPGYTPQNDSTTTKDDKTDSMVVHFNTEHYIKMGAGLVSTLLQLSIAVGNDIYAQREQKTPPPEDVVVCKEGK